MNFLVGFLFVSFYSSNLYSSENITPQEDEKEMPKIEALQLSNTPPEPLKPAPVITISNVLDESEVYGAGL